MPRYLRTNKKTGSSSALQKIKRNIYWQAGLALITVVLTIVIVFTMTAAWYTNIVQTSGLMFQTESWGFDGSVKVLSQSVVAAPGDEGVIGLEVENTNDSMAAVSVSVSKSGISDNLETKAQMQKRLYFYIDTQMTRNGETMERVYLNSQENYTYTLFSQGKLVLSDQLHNDALLKWQWVYDVLGYYVLGTYSEEKDNVTVLEYLRPIEYDYDDATTVFNSEDLTMPLMTVNGVSVDEFLVQLSETDGYPGTINPADKTRLGYYPVAIDENGYGVYAYLCTFAEIELATQYDTQLAAAAAETIANGQTPESYLIQLNIAAQKNDENILNIGSLDALQEAIALNSGWTLQLTGDLVLSADDKLVIPAGTRTMLDLNGHSITSETSGNAIDAEPGSSLTVINGTITGSGDGRGINAVGAEVVCNKVNLSGFRYGIYVGDQKEDSEGKVNSLDSRVRLVDCDLDAELCTVFVAGNGDASAQKTQLLIDDCDLSSDSFVISGNGTYWGTDIQIMNSTLTSAVAGVSTAVYHPQKNSTLTIFNSEITAYTGIAVKGGTVYVNGSKIVGLGAANAPAFSGSGFSDTGDGIYIETNYDWPITVEVDSAVLTDQNGNPYHKASVITSLCGQAVQIYKPDATNVTLNLISGVFNEETYVPEGYELVQDSDGGYIFKEKSNSQ